MVYILFSRCASYNMGEGVAVEAATESQLITGRRNKNEEKNLIFVEEGGGEKLSGCQFKTNFCLSCANKCKWYFPILV